MEANLGNNGSTAIFYNKIEAFQENFVIFAGKKVNTYSYETSITYGYLISPMKMRSL